MRNKPEEWIGFPKGYGPEIGFWIDRHSMVIDMNDVKLVTLEQL
jgi:hypothetical protein